MSRVRKRILFTSAEMGRMLVRKFTGSASMPGMLDPRTKLIPWVAPGNEVDKNNTKRPYVVKHSGYATGGKALTLTFLSKC